MIHTMWFPVVWPCHTLAPWLTLWLLTFRHFNTRWLTYAFSIIHTWSRLLGSLFFRWWYPLKILIHPRLFDIILYLVCILLWHHHGKSSLGTSVSFQRHWTPIVCNLVLQTVEKGDFRCCWIVAGIGGWHFVRSNAVEELLIFLLTHEGQTYFCWQESE